MLWQPWQPVSSKMEVTSPHYEEEEVNHDYRFYDLLPKQQMTPVPEQAVPESKAPPTVVIVEAPKSQTQDSQLNPNTDTATPNETAPVAAEVHTTQFILQIGSFNNPDSADTQRAKVILNGLSADVITMRKNGETWYRVVSGPYTSQSSAVAAQQTLQNSNIDSIIVKN